MTLVAGAQVTDNIRLVRLLGRGGMGSVWVARHTTLDVDVAVKFIAAELLNGGDPIVLTRFRREAQLAAKLDSPHVVRTLDHGVTDDGTPYIVMELLRGESLADRMARDGRVGARDAARIVSEIATGLAVAHAAEIVHRDIKPHNIFLSTGPNRPMIAKVLDFGVAKATTNETQPLATSSGVLIGTPQYMSPEQLMRAGAVDSTADLWALSVTAYEMLVGKLPFRGETLAATLVAITRADLQPPSSVDTSLPTALDTWFRRALAIDPDRRFATASELAEAFEAAVEGVPTGEITRGLLPRQSSPTTRADETAATAEFVLACDLEVPTSLRGQALAATQPVAALSAPPNRMDESQPIALVGKARASTDEASSVPGTPTARSPGESSLPAPAAPPEGSDAVGLDAPPAAPEGSTQTALARGDAARPGDVAVAQNSLGSQPSRVVWVGGLAAAAATLVGAYFLFGNRSTPPSLPLAATASAAAPSAPSSAPAATEHSASSPSASASAATPPKLGAIPKTTIAAGYAPASRVWLAEYAIAREPGDENASFSEAQSACERRLMSLCSDAQWARACESQPEIAERSSWTVTGAERGIVVRGGASNATGSEGYGFGGTAACTNRQTTDPGTRSPERIGLCCTRSIGVASTIDSAAFLKTTAAKLVEYETAYDSGNGDRIAALMDDPVEFHGKVMSREDLPAAAVWMAKQGRLIHDVCDVSIEKKDGQSTWTADCTVIADGSAGLVRGVRRYVHGGEHGLVQAVREPRSPVRLGSTAPGPGASGSPVSPNAPSGVSPGGTTKAPR